MAIIPKSLLTKVIEELPDTWKMTASGVKNFLTKKGVKEEELKWSGMDENLATYDPNATLPKVDLVDMLKDRQDTFTNKSETGVYEHIVTPNANPDSYNINVRGFKQSEADRNVYSHFPETDKNYLFHARSGDRKIGGLDTHEVYEFQSDLHQQGRIHGYTDEFGPRPDAALKDNWLVKGIEQELLTALEKGKSAVAVPLEGAGTNSLIRAKGVQEWYKNSVRNTLKKTAKRIGGKYKEVTEELAGHIQIKQPADLYDELMFNEDLRNFFTETLQIETTYTTNDTFGDLYTAEVPYTDIADEIAEQLSQRDMTDFLDQYAPDWVMKAVAENPKQSVTYGQIILPESKLKQMEVPVEVPSGKELRKLFFEANDPQVQALETLQTKYGRSTMTETMREHWDEAREILQLPSTKQVPAHTTKITKIWDEPPQSGYELTKLRREFPEEYLDILGEVNESLGKPWNATGIDAPELDDILNYVQTKWSNIKQALNLPIIKEEKDYSAALPEWAKKLELYTAAGATAGIAATSSDDASASDNITEDVNKLLTAGIAPDEIRQTLPTATTKVTRDKVETILAKNEDGATTEVPIDTSRPKLENEDGSFSTERTIGIEMDGKYYNIPTIVNGKQLTEDEAVEQFKAGNNPPVGEYSSQEEADAAAPIRSEAIGIVRGTDTAIAEDNPVITAIERGYSIDEIKSYLSESQGLSPEDAHSSILDSFKTKVDAARGKASDEEIKAYLKSEYGLNQKDAEAVMFKAPSIAEPSVTNEMAMPELGATPEIPLAKPEQPRTLKPELKPVNPNPTFTDVDTAELSSMLRTIHDRDMPVIDYAKGELGDARAKSRSDTFDQQLSYTIANSLRQMGKNVTVNVNNELVEILQDGTEVEVDESIFAGLKNRSAEILGGVAGGLAGSAAGVRAVAPISSAVGVLGIPGKIAGAAIAGVGAIGGAVAAGAPASMAGRSIDIARNAFATKQDLDMQHYIDAMKDTGQFAVLAEVIGTPIVNMGVGTVKTLYRASKAVIDGNTAGAYKALKENLHLDDNQVDEIIKSWEELSTAEAPGMTRETKALHVLPQVQPGGEAIVGPAASINPRLSSNISKSVDDRAKNLLTSSKNLTADNIGTVLHDELDRYKKDVKSYFGGIKKFGVDQMRVSGFTFDYANTAVEPLIENITSKIRNPAVAENFKLYVDRIRKLGVAQTEDGIEVNPLRSFEDLLDLRHTINEFMQNKKIRNVADFDMVNKVISNIDAEITRGAKNMPEGKAWLKEWKKANTEYGKMKKLEENVLYKALTAKGANPVKIVNDLSRRITAIDGTFMEVLGTLPKHVRDQAEGAVLDNLIKRHTVGFEGNFQATNFVQLADELKHVGFTSEGTRELKRAVSKMAEVFKNDVDLQKATGKIVKPEFKSYLTTDPVIRAKYEVASSVFNYIRRLFPTAQGEATAMITKVAKVLENPVSSKAIADIEKMLPNDPELATSIRQLALQYAKFGEKTTYPKVEVFRSGIPGSSYKSIDGPLGKGIYWTTDKTSAVGRANKTGGQVISEKLLPSRVATEDDVKLLLGVDTIDKARFKTDASIAKLLKSRGYDGLSIGNDIVMFKE